MSKLSCQWCNEKVHSFPVTNQCTHKICSKCLITSPNCQSNCPKCWYTNAAQFISTKKICAVCCQTINGVDKSFSCEEHHQHCYECLNEGCILCQFHQLTLPKNKKKTIGKNSVQTERIFYTCETWERIFEKLISSSSSINDHAKYVSGVPSSKEEDSKNEEIGDCIICMEPLGSSYRTLGVCAHRFHHSCIETWFDSSGKESCPSCGHVYGISKGPQPADGQMEIRIIKTVLPGFEKEKYSYHEGPTIEITYQFPSGFQGPQNVNPGKRYSAMSRVAYLPNNNEGKEILRLLRKAFAEQHVFTIGKSVTTGQENVITWNDIHHKTSIYGGPDRYGYPDPTYLSRVRQELADKGFQ